MLLEKPQSKVVERVLTDVYNAGRDAVLRAYTDWELTDRKTDFMVWYQSGQGSTDSMCGDAWWKDAIQSDVVLTRDEVTF